jgi:hypothetical protein
MGPRQQFQDDVLRPEARAGRLCGRWLRWLKPGGSANRASNGISTYKLFRLWQDHPDYFNADSDADRANNYASWANQQKSITEISDQYYFMLDGKTAKNRLGWVIGTRKEIATRKGYATKKDNNWNFVQNKDGT